MIDHVVVDYSHQLIDQEGLFLGADVPGARPRDQAAGDLCPARGECLTEQCNNLPARGGRPAIIDQIGDLPGERAPVNDRTLLCDAA
jgi:hypothetical protein